jgi:hypothetical protein
MDQNIVGAGTLLLDVFVSVESAEQILGVKPTSYGHHRRLDISEMRKRIASLPV